MAASQTKTTGADNLLHDLVTPCLIVYKDVLRRNCVAMSEKANKLGVSLRPHVKTHKTIEAHTILKQTAAEQIVGCVASTMTVRTLKAPRTFSLLVSPRQQARSSLAGG
jgi:D-serine deaminase-like pyridoxal phosphate-dependent protein